MIISQRISSMFAETTQQSLCFKKQADRYRNYLDALISNQEAIETQIEEHWEYITKNLDPEDKIKNTLINTIGNSFEQMNDGHASPLRSFLQSKLERQSIDWNSRESKTIYDSLTFVGDERSFSFA